MAACTSCLLFELKGTKPSARGFSSTNSVIRQDKIKLTKYALSLQWLISGQLSCEGLQY